MENDRSASAPTPLDRPCGDRARTNQQTRPAMSRNTHYDNDDGFQLDL